MKATPDHKLTCQQCGKKLTRKTARLVEGRTLCSTCMFTPQRMKGARDRDATLAETNEDSAPSEGSQPGPEGDRPDAVSIEERTHTKGEGDG